MAGNSLVFLKELLFRDPPKIHKIHRDNPRAYFRVSKLWRILSLAAMTTHLLLFFVFLAIGIREMIFFNLASIAIWIIGLLLLRGGFFYTAYSLEMLEVLCHSVAATLLVGKDTGFIYYMIVVPLVGLINPLRKNPLDIGFKIFFFIVPILAFILSWNQSYNHESIYSLSRDVVILLQMVNLIIAILFIVMIGGFFAYLVKQAEDDLEREYRRSESLLLNILPPVIAERLKSAEETIADRFDEATVLFLDIVSFTELSAHRSPDEIVGLLDDLFSRFDALSDTFGLEKIKTIGDAYMAAAGIPTPAIDHAFRAMEMAIAMMRTLDEFNESRSESIQARIGLCSGPVVAGVIGRRKFIYDLWGDTVNTASRMESHGSPGRIHVTESTYRIVEDRYSFSCRGKTYIKGKGDMVTYLLERAQAQARI